MTTKLMMMIFLAMAGVTGCKSDKQDVDNLGRANAPAPTNAAAASTPMETASTGKIHKGTIVEAIDVANYTYIRFKDKQNVEHWAAVLKGKFEVGKEISVVESIVQKNFTSPTLKRTFDSIVFGNAVVNGVLATPTSDNSDNMLPKGHPPIDGKQMTPQMPAGHPPVIQKASAAPAPSETPIDSAPASK